MTLRAHPPSIEVKLSWRELYLDGAFAQRELIGDGPLSRQAGERSIRLGIGQAPLEELDLASALQPIGFADGGYWSGFELPAIPRDVDDGVAAFHEESPICRGFIRAAREAAAYSNDGNAVLVHKSGRSPRRYGGGRCDQIMLYS